MTSTPVGNTWYAPPELSAPGQVADNRTEIGVIAPSYGLEHLTYLMNLDAYRHVLLRRLPLQKFEKRGTFWDKTPVMLRAPVPLVHTFNHLPMTGPPFVVSFEMELPFYLGPHVDWQHRVGHRLLASDRCRGILALSDTAAELARRKYTDLGLPEVVAKIQTFRGAVLPSRQSSDRVYSAPEAPLRLLFVGSDGLRKGLVPLLAALRQLHREGAQLELTVVSAVSETSYAVVKDDTSVQDIRKGLAETPWITHHRSLGYAAVREAMATHDLFLFPTLDETLGWVVIEAAMEGMGTIASNVFALPELVKDQVTGRVLELPLNGQRRWAGLFEKDRGRAQAEVYAYLQSGIYGALRDVLNNRALVAQWGGAARRLLAPIYDPDAAAAQLAGIYRQALGRAPV